MEAVPAWLQGMEEVVKRRVKSREKEGGNKTRNGEERGISSYTACMESVVLVVLGSSANSTEKQHLLPCPT